MLRLLIQPVQGEEGSTGSGRLSSLRLAKVALKLICLASIVEYPEGSESLVLPFTDTRCVFVLSGQNISRGVVL